MMPPNHLIFCCPLLLLPSMFPSIRVFYNELALFIRWPKYWSFSINPSSEYSRLISFRIDCFNFLAVKGLSRVFSSTTVWKHQFFSILPSLAPSSHIHIWLLEKTMKAKSLSRVQLFATPWTAACQAPQSSTMSWSLFKFKTIELVMLYTHLVLCHALLLLPSIFPSIRVFLSESAFHIRWPKYWSFSINPSNEYSRLIFFQINWFDLLAVQRTLKSLPQHHNLKASILCLSVFFRV